MTIESWLSDASKQFTRAGIPTAQLDAEVLLCHLLGVDRSYLIAHGDESLARIALSHKGGVHPGGVKEYGEKLVLGRLKRKPIAYLVGHKEFYGRDFIVDKHVLVPRPESEALIEILKTLPNDALTTIVDVGTGSGALAITAKLERPTSKLIATDISPEALEVARKNAKKLKASIEFIESDLLSSFPSTNTPLPTTILANLPYVDRTWERSPETDHEPYQALFAQDGGLALIKELINQTPNLLSRDGYLLLEADPEQHEAITKYSNSEFRQIKTQDYAVLLQKK